MATLRNNVVHEIGTDSVRKIIDHGENGCEVIISQKGEADFQDLYKEALEHGAIPGAVVFFEDPEEEDEVVPSEDVVISPGYAQRGA